MNNRIVFFQVRDNGSKIQKIIEMATFHLHKKEKLLFFVEDEKAEKFVDELLWKVGFLPHVTADGPTNDFLVITKLKVNVNEASFAFNLCPTPLFLNDAIPVLYEFEDGTTPVKKNFSSVRFDAYKKAGYLIEARL